MRTEQKLSLLNELKAGRLDLVLSSALPDLTRSKIQKLIKDDKVKVSNVIQRRPAFIVSPKEVIEVDLTPDEEITLRKAYDFPVDIRYEDSNLLVVYKQAGLITHPGIGDKDRTLVNALSNYYQNSNNQGTSKIMPVHRLDKDTEGLLLVAKNDVVHYKLCDMLKNRRIKRKYIAITYKNPSIKTKDTIRTLIRPSRRDKRIMCIGVTTGKEAITHYEVIAETKQHYIMECTLETGRTHQIRVHMLHIGCPIIGDPVYDNKNLSMKNNPPYREKSPTYQALIAYHIEFTHPITQEILSFTNELNDFVVKHLPQII